MNTIFNSQEQVYINAKQFILPYYWDLLYIFFKT